MTEKRRERNQSGIAGVTSTGVPESGDAAANASVCSICLEEPPNCPVDTNCGHRFCASCMLNLWHQERHPLPCKCPLCRREVTLLLGAQDFSASHPRLYEGVLTYNQHMAESQGGLWSRLKDLPILLQYLRRDVIAMPGTGLPICSKLYLLALILVVLVYVISPIDFIPEGIFGIFGLVDDVFVVIYLLLYSTYIYRNWVVQLRQNQT